MHTLHLAVKVDRGTRRALNLLNLLQGEWDLDLARKAPDQEHFVRGWLERVEIRSVA